MKKTVSNTRTASGREKLTAKIADIVFHMRKREKTDGKESEMRSEKHTGLS